MKTRTKIPAKVVAKSPQKPIQTTFKRHSISRDVSEKFKIKTGESNRGLFSHQLSNISLLRKQKATNIPTVGKHLNSKTIHPKQSHQAIQSISSSPQQLQGIFGGGGGGIKISTPKFIKDAGKNISNAGKSLVGGVTDLFTQQFNSGKGDADRILKNAEREANRVIQAGEAEAKRIMGDTSVSTSQSRSGGGFLSKIKTAIRSFKAPRIFAKLENNAITPTGGALIQGFFGKISKAIKRAVSRASRGKITFNSGGKYNARGRAKAVAARAKKKARRVAALARLRAKRFLRQRERVAKYLVNSAKTRAKRINQDAKSRSQRMMQRGEYTAAKSLLYKEKRRARLLVYRNNRYARNILNKAQPIANRIIAKGKIRAERIIAWGERRADSIIQDGQRRADNVIRQAQQRAERIREKGKRDADAAIRRRQKNVFQKLAGWIGDGIRGLANAVGNFIKAAGNFLGKIARGAVNFLKAVGKGIQRLGNAIYQGAKQAWNYVKQVAKKAAQLVVAIVKEAVKVVKEIAQTIIDVIAAPFKVLWQLQQLMRQIGGKVASVGGKIAKNPLKFGETLINGGKAGFNRFTSQFPQHLENGVQGYLFGETNIKLPSFDAKGIITMLLQTVGLSRDSVREMAVAKLGEEKVAFAEGFSEAASEGKMGEFPQDQAQTYANNVANQVGNQTQLSLLAKLFKALSQGGKGIINFFKELNLSELIKTIVIDGIKNFLIETIQNKAIPYAMAKLAASATPIVGWIMAAIDGLKMANEIFVKRAQQVKALVDSLGDAVVNAASYAEGGVASQLEAGMKKAIPILMSALASYANIGDIPSKIKGVIDKGKNWVNENIKPFINKVIDTVGSLIPDLSGKQLATGITKGLGIGNLYDKIRNYLKPHTQKPFQTFNDAKQVVDTAQTLFKPLGINSLNLEQADKTGHSFNVIAAKPLPGRKVSIAANPIRISRKSTITNSINSKKVMRSSKDFIATKSPYPVTSLSNKTVGDNHHSRFLTKRKLQLASKYSIMINSIKVSSRKIQRQPLNNVGQITTIQANSNNEIILYNDTNYSYHFDYIWTSSNDIPLQRLTLKPGEKHRFIPTSPQLRTLEIYFPNEGNTIRGADLRLSPGKHNLSDYTGSQSVGKDRQNKKNIFKKAAEQLGRNDFGLLVQSTEQADSELKQGKGKKLKGKKLRKILQKIGNHPATKVLSRVMAVVSLSGAIIGIWEAYEEYSKTKRWTWKLTLNVVESLAVLLAAGIAIAGFFVTLSSGAILLASIAATIAGAITLYNVLRGWNSDSTKSTTSSNQNSSQYEPHSPNRSRRQNPQYEPSISIQQLDHYTNKNRVWLVENPSWYNQYKQGKKSFTRLQKGTKLQVINLGENRRFNRTEDRYKWVEVLTATGQQGWVMKVLVNRL